MSTSRPTAEQFDVIIVGARCAGAPLATLLARAGIKVCVVDRAGFPSDTPSTHGIQPAGVKILDRLDVLEPLLKVAPPIERGTLQLNDNRIEVESLSQVVGAPMVNVRRVTLDAILLDAAAAAGAEVRSRTTVTGLVEERGRVAGVETTEGKLRAPLVVGADGARSTVARLVGAGEYHRILPGGIFSWAYLEGVPVENDRIWLGKIGEHGFLASPTDAGLFMAAVVLPMERRDEIRRDRESVYVAALTNWPELEASLAGARRVGPVRMMSRWHGFFRESAGPGWVLVGDAGHFKDPTPGQGIGDAFRQVEALAPAILSALDGSGQGLDRALARWGLWRDEDAAEHHWFAIDLGKAGPVPAVLPEIQRRLLAQGKIDLFLNLFAHRSRPSEVFTPVRLLGATAGLLARRGCDRRTLLREVGALVAEDARRKRLDRRPAYVAADVATDAGPTEVPEALAA
jgi:2-polyprenyl-6-methoxyphenol hydroxylase-like FAD-dependent oxidoreductase